MKNVNVMLQPETIPNVKFEPASGTSLLLACYCFLCKLSSNIIYLHLKFNGPNEPECRIWNLCPPKGDSSQCPVCELNENTPLENPCFLGIIAAPTSHFQVAHIWPKTSLALIGPNGQCGVVLKWETIPIIHYPFHELIEIWPPKPLCHLSFTVGPTSHFQIVYIWPLWNLKNEPCAVPRDNAQCLFVN